MRMRFILAVAIFLQAGRSYAQPIFLPSVKVEFVRTTSVRQMMKDYQQQSFWYEQNKDRYPVSQLHYFEFIGDSVQSLYKPGKESPVSDQSFFRAVGDKNIVFADYRAGTLIAQKAVYDETFLLKDSSLRIQWKITQDVRNIAGFDCRKAIGILDDTVAIFAFFTEEILVPGGPEGVQGLPGMILGMGIPRLHTTWFASKVELLNPGTVFRAPGKGKLVNRQHLQKELQVASKGWGSYWNKMILHFML